MSDLQLTNAKLTDMHRDTYDLSAQEYDERAMAHQYVADGAMAKLKDYLPSGARVLDVGCAVGNITKSLVEMGYKSTGIDISPEMIKYARARTKEANFEVVDLMDYRSSELFDGVVAFAFIHLFPKEILPEVMHKLHSLLDDRGILYTGSTVSDKFQQGVETKHDYRHPVKRFRARWTREALEGEFNDSGFEVVEAYQHVDGVGKTWMDYVLRKRSAK